MTQQQGEQRIPPTIIYIIMQQEDDLRALAKIMEFGRAVSIFILVVHVYVYCYPSMSAWHLNLDVIDRILMNFDRTTGIFGCILWTKLMAVLLLAISCMGTIGVKGEKITWQRIWAVLTAGAVLFFMNWWLLDLPFPHEAITALYVVTLAAGYLCLLMAGLWISRLYRHNLMEDVFNMENESFMQETRLMENEYSVNLPTRFQYGGKLNDGWINVVNPFRGRRRTNRAISVKLIYWLKLNVNNLKSAIWVKQRKITENIRKGMTSGWLGTSVGNCRFCFPEFPTNLRTPNGLNSIILSQFGMCK